MFYGVHTDLLPNFYVDISEEIEKKQSLIQKYTSQLEDRRYDHMSRGLDAWRSRYLPGSGQARYIEAFMGIPSEGYADFQKIYKRVDAHKLFKGHEACIQSFRKIKN